MNYNSLLKFSKTHFINLLIHIRGSFGKHLSGLLVGDKSHTTIYEGLKRVNTKTSRLTVVMDDHDCLNISNPIQGKKSVQSFRCSTPGISDYCCLYMHSSHHPQ